jgi:hypothetical protein
MTRTIDFKNSNKVRMNAMITRFTNLHITKWSITKHNLSHAVNRVYSCVNDVRAEAYTRPAPAPPSAVQDRSYQCPT